LDDLFAPLMLEIDIDIGRLMRAELIALSCTMSMGNSNG
jgi:hypothetical protein